MSVKIRIKGREFTLEWTEFLKVLERRTINDVVEVLDVRGGRHVVA